MGRIKPQALLLQSKKKKGPAQVNVKTIITFTVLLVFVVLSLYATYKNWYRRSNDQVGDNLNKFENLETFSEASDKDLPRYVILNTSKGSITMELYKDASHAAVNKFIGLCQKGYFKGKTFHHVIKNFVIQGGALHGHVATEDWTLKGKSVSRPLLSPKHEAFTVGTSKAKHDNDEFQIYITTAPIPDLSHKLIVFGRVVKGEDVVQEIEEVDTDEHYQPKSPVEIINVTLKNEL